jgi:hypothetical protein
MRCKYEAFHAEGNLSLEESDFDFDEPIPAR